jgi:uncharacterized membrane protein YgcG
MIYLLAILIVTMFLVGGTIFFSRNWKFSATICLLISVICSLAYFYALTHRGLPSHGIFPDQFVFLSVTVKEPDNNTRGAIYYWIRPIPSDANRTPLSVKVPYSEAEHRRAQEIQRRLQNNQTTQARRGTSQSGSSESSKGRSQDGQSASGRRGTTDGVGSGGGAGSASGSNSGESTQSMTERNIPNYYFELIEPENSLPPKDGQAAPITEPRR